MTIITASVDTTVVSMAVVSMAVVSMAVVAMAVVAMAVVATTETSIDHPDGHVLAPAPPASTPALATPPPQLARTLKFSAIAIR
jgi:hypothetical protein